MNLRFSEAEQIYAEIDFSRLKETLLNIGRLLHYSKGMTLTPAKDEVLVVLSGKMTVSKDKQSGLVVGDTFPFLPLGLLEQYDRLKLYYHVESEVTLVQLPIKDFNDIFHHNPEYSQLLTRILTNLSTRIIYVYYERINDSGYATIKEMLYRYIYKAEEGVLHNEGIATFILKRTRLSRSYVFQILSGLKEGEYITIRSGKLISINKNIPERF